MTCRHNLSYLPLDVLLLLLVHHGDALDLLEEVLGTKQALDDLFVLGHGHFLVCRQILSRCSQILVSLEFALCTGTDKD